MDQVMDIVKLNKFHLLKKEVDQFWQQSKNLSCENRRLEHKVEILIQVMLWMYNLFITLLSKLAS